MIFDQRFFEQALKNPPMEQGTPGEFRVDSFSTDSRTIQPGQCFIGIKGDNFDGNAFAVQAWQQGVRIFILEKKGGKKVLPLLTDSRVWLVNDSLTALGQLAKTYKNEIFCSVMALTGSSGKTTTRELIVAILSRKYNIHSARKNLNNEIGLPLTMLEAPPTSHIMVLEMGMNHTGEIMRLSQMSEPLVGLITNVGYAHIGLLGSQDAIADAKSEIFTGLNPRGFMFLNRDDSYFSYFQAKCPATVIEYGKSDLTIVQDLGLEGYLLSYQGQEFRFPLPGQHNLENLAAGLAVGEFYQVGLADRIDAVQKFSAVAQRSEIIKKNDITLINDCYNANPSSMQAALRLLSGLKPRRVAILSDMLELGRHAAPLHRMIGEFIGAEQAADLVLGYGPLSREIESVLRHASIQTMWADDLDGLVKLSREQVRSGDTVLVKASRGMHLEEVVKALTGAK